MSIIAQTGVGSQYDSKRKYQYIEMSKGCSMYDPCPLTYKCMNKASHLYQRCVNCPIPHVTSTHKQRTFMIRRENFAVTVTDETGEKLLQWKADREHAEAIAQN